MARYYFDIRDGKATEDEVGEELPSFSAAQKTAQDTLAEILRFHDEVWEGHTLAIDILGPDRELIATLSVSSESRLL